VRGGLAYVDGKYEWRDGFASPTVDNWEWSPAHYVWTERGRVFVDGPWDYPVKARGQVFAALDFQNDDYAQPDFHLLTAYPVALDAITETEAGWRYRLEEDVDLAQNTPVSFVAPADVEVPAIPVAVVAPAAVVATPAPRVAVVRGVAKRRRLTVAGIEVQLEGSPIPPVETDASGRFEFRNVPYGEYTITASGPVQNITRQGMAVVPVAAPVVDKVTIELE
jgi:hypothetical protein